LYSTIRVSDKHIQDYGVRIEGLVIWLWFTFQVEGDPDPVGAGADPRAVQDRLRGRHCQNTPILGMGMLGEAVPPDKSVQRLQGMDEEDEAVSLAVSDNQPPNQKDACLMGKGQK
jgi:hypothetical protein